MKIFWVPIQFSTKLGHKFSRFLENWSKPIIKAGWIFQKLVWVASPKFGPKFSARQKISVEFSCIDQWGWRTNSTIWGWSVGQFSLNKEYFYFFYFLWLIICRIFMSPELWLTVNVSCWIWLLEVWLVDRRWPIKSKCLLSVFNPISKLIFWRDVHLEHVHLNTILSSEPWPVRPSLTKRRTGPSLKSSVRHFGRSGISGRRKNVAGKRVFGVFNT